MEVLNQPYSWAVSLQFKFYMCLVGRVSFIPFKIIKKIFLLFSTEVEKSFIVDHLQTKFIKVVNIEAYNEPNRRNLLKVRYFL